VRTGLLKPQTKMSAKGAVPGTNAYKVGARTGATAGCISHYQSRVKLKQLVDLAAQLIDNKGYRQQ
jgi:hypothetical protein